MAKPVAPVVYFVAVISIRLAKVGVRSLELRSFSYMKLRLIKALNRNTAIPQINAIRRARGKLYATRDKRLRYRQGWMGEEGPT